MTFGGLNLMMTKPFPPPMSWASFGRQPESPRGQTRINRSYPDQSIIWQVTLRLAKSTSGKINISSSTFDLERVLYRTPALPETISRDATWIEGYSLGRNSNTSCRGGKAEKARKLPLRKLHPTTCTLSKSRNFVEWNGSASNGISLLILGWAYILSASLAEWQGLDMEYGQFLDHPVSAETNLNLKLDLDYARPHELAWWKAIATRGVR